MWHGLCVFGDTGDYRGADASADASAGHCEIGLVVGGRAPPHPAVEHTRLLLPVKDLMEGEQPRRIRLEPCKLRLRS